MYTLLNARDQIEFPNTALELPGTKRHERNEEQNRERTRNRQKERRVTASWGAAVLTAGVTASHRVTVGRRHGMLGMFCIDSGIIL
jgi:hypothetical protein